MSYTELLERLAIRKGSLTHHLNRLMEAGIIDNYSGEDFGGPYTSYYQFSSFGKDLIAGVLSSIEVTPFLEQKEKPLEPQISDLRKREIEKQSEYVFGEKMIDALRVVFKESKEPSVFYSVFDKKTMDKADPRNMPWALKELRMNIRNVKTNE